MSTPSHHNTQNVSLGDELFVNVREAGHLLLCSESTIRRHIRAGRLPVHQIVPGGKILIRSSDIMACLKRAENAPWGVKVPAVAEYARGQYQA